MLVRAYRAVSRTRLQSAVFFVFLLGLFRLAISTPLLASSALNILPFSPQTLPESSAYLSNDSIPGPNGATPSSSVLSPPITTNNTSVGNENQGWPPIPFLIPMRGTTGRLRFTRLVRQGTAEQKDILRAIIRIKLNEWANQPEAAACGAFIKTEADVRFRMNFQSLHPHRPPLNYSWARSALQSFSDFADSREPREVRFAIDDGRTTLAKLKADWLR